MALIVLVQAAGVKKVDVGGGDMGDAYEEYVGVALRDRDT
jgi:hypothetical protein